MIDEKEIVKIKLSGTTDSGDAQIISALMQRHGYMSWVVDLAGNDGDDDDYPEPQPAVCFRVPAGEKEPKKVASPEEIQAKDPNASNPQGINIKDSSIYKDEEEYVGQKPTDES